ncbi:non-specific lipid-transfer protein A-like [Rosa rugosa]|uniref:non-specific lipid-transfer protein A-like n=1 Tax=Rosa rugosa TaxID=74645 RepID=UPI002B417010|nr:non-specific lipid-transfer protein A-like [Rosa rugosa]
MKGIVISMFLVLGTVHLMVHQGEAVECTQVNRLLAPCIPYLTGKATEPTEECCRGVSDIKTLTPTTEDRQEACGCVKTAAAHIPNVDPAAAAALPTECKVDIGIPISKNTNCQDVK